MKDILESFFFFFFSFSILFSAILNVSNGALFFGLPGPLLPTAFHPASSNSSSSGPAAN